MIGQSLGADFHNSRFTVWAPEASSVEVCLLAAGESSAKQPVKPYWDIDGRSIPARIVPLEPAGAGYWTAELGNMQAGQDYYYRLNGTDLLPDPCSHFQAYGIEGPSRVVDHSYPWQDDGWKMIPLEEMITYEIHTGTFTDRGTFDGIEEKLDYLGKLGVTAVELMPVAQFPGKRNWGYDGVFPFAVQNSYGGPEGLKHLVDTCHGKGFAVVLDVVYNHLGPEGNVLIRCAPYFTDRYRTPWGHAVNFDGPFSDEVRHYFIRNALYWLDSYHIDALRLDAVHAIYDFSAYPFLTELSDAVADYSNRRRRRCYLIGESDLNDPAVIRPRELCGYGLDAQWSDDFHHSIHALLTGEDSGYYADFGSPKDLADSYSEAYVYARRYSAYREKKHGDRADDRPGRQFFICIQNHDQIGNRMFGERLSSLVSYDEQKLAALALLFAPYPPVLFMGQEYGETSPFLYFIDHLDPGLVRAVREGRKEEFRAFSWMGEPPDPKSPDTCRSSTLKWNSLQEEKHKKMHELYSSLLRLRKETPAWAALDRRCMEVRIAATKLLLVRRWNRIRFDGPSAAGPLSGRGMGSEALALFNFGGPVSIPEKELFPGNGGAASPAGGEKPVSKMKKAVDTAEEYWLGEGSLLPETIDTGGAAGSRSADGALLEISGRSGAIYLSQGTGSRGQHG